MSLINTFIFKQKTEQFIINKVEYTYEFLRNNIPYLIEFDTNTKNYYILNRNYEYIGENTKDPNKIYKNMSQFENRIYLFDDSCKPWDNKQNLNNLIIKFKQSIKNLNECKNIKDFSPESIF